MNMYNFYYTSILKIIVIFCSFVLLAKLLWSKRKHILLSWKLSGPFSIPFIGCVSYALKMHKDDTLLYMLLQGFRDHKGFFRLWLGTHLYVVAYKPEDIESIFCASIINKPPLALTHWGELMGDGILTKTDLSKDPFYKIHKKIISPSLTTIINKDYYYHVRINCYHLEKEIEKLCNKGFVDFAPQLMRFCYDSVAESFYGIEFKFRDGHRDGLSDAVDTVTDALVERFAHVWLLLKPIYNISSYAKKHRAGTQKIRDFANEILETKLNNDDNMIYPENATMKLLLEAYENGKISKDELIGEIMNLWIAGSDTVNMVIKYVFLMLAMHKSCQDKVFEEIKAFCGKHQDTVIEYEDLHQFPYTEMCIKEAMRLFPPGPFAARHTSKPFHFKNRNLNIPADITFIYSSYITHRDPEVWPNPEEYNPERFTPEESAKRNPCAWLPFSGGPRKCSGRAFAMMLLKASVIHIIRKHEFTCDWKLKDLSFVYLVSIHSKKGHKACITERQWK